ncbi:MAG: DoxX family protein [Cyanobacteria bacterium J06626_18]
MDSQKYLPLIARTFLGGLFFQSGIRKILGFAATQQELTEAGIPLAAGVTLFMIVVELIGGASILLGYRVQIGVILVLLYLVPSTLIFHNPLVDSSQMIEFMKNLAIVGGLLMFTAYGPGSVSLERRFSTTRNPQYSEE